MRKLTFISTVAAASLAVTAAHAQDTGSVVHGGQILADIVAWGEAAFGTALAAVATAGIYKFMQWMGIQVTDGQKAQLQAIVVNGLNDAAAKAQTSLRSDVALDINTKNKIINDAVVYAQVHASDTIKALGLDPDSGEAVEAIRARIATALNDPTTPTPPAITPTTGQSR